MRRSVLTITPNPALDLSGVVDRLTPNEKAYVHDEKRCPGGNAINSARILHRLRVPVVVGGFIGGGIGAEVDAMLSDEGLRRRFVSIQGETRVNVTVSNAADLRQTRLSFPGPRIRAAEKKLLHGEVANLTNTALMLVGGSLPPGMDGSDIRRLVRAAAKSGVPSIVDCPGHILAEAIEARPLMIKPNLEEFREMTGRKSVTIEEVARHASSLLALVPMICVSSVEGGALLLTRTGRYFGRIPELKICSTVGAGDSMVGAMASRLYLGAKDGADILRWGLAASAATLSEPGLSLGRRAEIIRLYGRTKVKRCPS